MPLLQSWKEGEGPLDPRGIAVSAALRERTHFQIFADRHIAEQLSALGDEDKTARGLGMGRKPRHVFTLEKDPAAPRRKRADQGFQCRGLAGTVGADKRGEPARRCLQRKSPYDLHLAVAGLQSLDLKQRLAHPTRPSATRRPAKDHQDRLRSPRGYWRSPPERPRPASVPSSTPRCGRKDP